MENCMERKWENFGKELLMHLWGPWGCLCIRLLSSSQGHRAAVSQHP